MTTPFLEALNALHDPAFLAEEWDMPAAPTPEAFAACARLMAHWPDVPAPEPVPTNNGSIKLEWHVEEKTARKRLTIMAQGDVVLYALSHHALSGPGQNTKRSRDEHGEVPYTDAIGMNHLHELVMLFAQTAECAS